MAIENHPGFVLALIAALVGAGYVLSRQQTAAATPYTDQRQQLCIQRGGCYVSVSGTCWTKQTDGSFRGDPVCLPGELCPQNIVTLPAGSAPPC